jgi:hypothetical protein
MLHNDSFTQIILNSTASSIYARFLKLSGVANFVGLPEGLATEITEKILRKTSKKLCVLCGLMFLAHTFSHSQTFIHACSFDWQVIK